MFHSRTVVRAFASLIPVLCLMAVPVRSAPPAASPAPADPAAPSAPPGPKVSLSVQEVPAAGRREAILSVDRFGRYSVRAESAQGTSIELIDRMAGSLGRSGEPGRENGRLDLILDRGTYKLVLRSHEKGKGTAKLKAAAFRDRGAPGTPLPRLPETRLVAETLDDLEQLSYWLEIPERREVRAEAAGRHLTDLRLWRDGSWLEGTTPECLTVQPVTGQPLLRCRIAAVLEPGLYLLVAYGGPSRPWAEGSDAHPLWLRWGLPDLGEAGRRRLAMSPFGEDWFRVDPSINFARLELPEALPAGVRLRWVRTGDPLSRGIWNEAAITKESVPPAAETFAPDVPGDDEEAVSEVVEEEEEPSEEEYVEESYEEGEEEYAEEESSEGEETEEMVEEEGEVAAAPEELQAWQLWLSVSAAPGQAYVLQYFERTDVRSLNNLSGPYWVSSVHAGAAADSIDATALLTVRPPSSPERLLFSRAIPLDGQTTWARRFNLLETATLFLEVRAAGKYRIVATDTPVRARVEPFLLSRPSNYEPPPFQGEDSRWDLDAGYYVLTLEPARQGIVSLSIRPAGAQEPAQLQPARADVRFAPIDLDPSNSYRMYVNAQPGVVAGLVVRPWPIDLARALPLALRPGEELKIAFTAAEDGTLRVEAEDGSRLPIALNGVPSIAEAAVAPGLHELTLRNPQAETVLLSVAVEPLALQGTTPLPPLPDAALAALPKFPVLRTGAPQVLDLERNARSTFLLQADKPALYEIRSTGLLATSGTLRTRTVPELRREEANGVGRNFLLQQYLREGDYQATVGTAGRSRGHLGLEVAATPVDDAGELRPEMPARWTLPAGRAAVWRFTIPRDGVYKLRAEGLRTIFGGRVEDADGWPVEPPNRELDFSRLYEAGSYRLVLLPQPLDTQALIRLEREAEPLRFAGHGPHELPLDRPVEHQWVEPTGEAPRQPDVWRIVVPARLTATVSLSSEMEGTITKEPSPPAPLPQAGEGSRLAEGNSEPTEPSNPHPSPTRGRGAGGEGSEVGRVPPGRSWTGELEPGVYQLAAVCSRRNNLVSYTVTVAPRELVAGLSRTVQAPASIPVSVGPGGLIELASVATSDVRAQLLDEQGGLVAEGDDRPDGWDFLLFQRLAPGRYTLLVSPVGSTEAEAKVSMRAAAEVAEGPLALPFHGEVRLGENVLLRPLPVGSRADLLLVAARSKDSLGLSVEARDGSGWRTLGTAASRSPRLEIPLERGGRSVSEYRLRLWSLDRQGTPARLSVAALAAPEVSEGDLRRGAALREVPGFDPPLGAGVLDLDRPGIFRVVDASPALRGGGTPGRPLAPLAPGEAQEGVLSVPGERAWVVREGKTRVIKAERIEAAPGLHAGLRFPLPAEGAVLDLSDERTDRSDRSDPSDAKATTGPLVALATAPAGQPGVRLGERGEPGEPNALAMATGTGSALAVDLTPRRPVARVWSAGSARAEEVRLAWLRLPEPAEEALSWGVRDGSLDGLAARRLALPDGPRTVRLALGEGTVAVLSRGDEILATSWQGGAPFQELLADDGAATHLTFLHLREGSDPFSVEILQAREDLALRTGQPVERLLDRAGVLRLEIPVSAVKPAARTLHLRGAGAEAVVLSRRGDVARGTDLPLPDGGTVLVRHGTGLLLAWVEQEGEEQSSLWPVPPEEKPSRVEPPAQVALSGPFAHFLIPAAAPRVLHVRTAAPVASLLRRQDGGAPEVEVHPEGARLDLFVPAGEMRLGLRALAGAALSGTAELTTTPVTAIGEGLGPAVLLPAGATRWFSFHLDRKGPVGAGVRSADDRVELELYDRVGRRLEGRESGVVRMLELEPGDYLLALKAPVDGPPVTARPALAGVVPPDTGPPEEVVREYLQKAAEEEATAAGSATETETETETDSEDTAAPESGSGRES